MFECADDVLAHHDDKVTLPQADRTAMRDRRNANRDRLKKGLKEAGKPAPREFWSQGSYAMKTMTQHPEKGLRHRRWRLFRQGGPCRRTRRRNVVRCRCARWCVTQSMMGPSRHRLRRARTACGFITWPDTTSTCRFTAGRQPRMPWATSTSTTSSPAAIGSAPMPGM